jgi:hypothetical protein
MGKHVRLRRAISPASFSMCDSTFCERIAMARLLLILVVFADGIDEGQP